MTIVILRQDQGYIGANGKRGFGKKGEKVDIDNDFLGFIKGNYEVIPDEAEKAQKEADELAAKEAAEKAQKSKKSQISFS